MRLSLLEILEATGGGEVGGTQVGNVFSSFHTDSRQVARGGVFFARRGELSSNRTEDHELSMLSLHLLQNCMVFVNTLMLQQVLARPHWAGRLTARIVAAELAPIRRLAQSLDAQSADRLAPLPVTDVPDEMSSFVGAINRVGKEKPWNIGEFYGKSYFCNPRGKIIAQASRDKDEVVVADLDLDMIAEVRKVWQFFRDRRPESYGPITSQTGIASAAD